MRKLVSIPSGVVVSDTTVMIGNLNDIETYEGGIFNGRINKCTISFENGIKAGMSTSKFVYFDGSLTMKGTELYTDTYNSVTSTTRIIYNNTFKKGWNEMVVKIDSYTETSTTITTVETYSNTVTPDMQWRYIPYNNYSLTISAKTRGLNGIERAGFLFQ